MKIRAINPKEANDNHDDKLRDVEVEATVAKINCILAREFEDGTEVRIAEEVIGISNDCKKEVIRRFKDMGWKVITTSYIDAFDGGRHYVYSFEKA